MLANMLAHCPFDMEQSVMFQLCSSSVCRSPCGHCWWEQVTSEAWQPGRTSFGPLTSSSLMTVEVANVEVAIVDMAEEQPEAQIGAI
jgi:hypothetical protein